MLPGEMAARGGGDIKVVHPEHLDDEEEEENENENTEGDPEHGDSRAGGFQPEEVLVTNW